MLKKNDRWRVALNQNERLLTPTKIDWWESAKAIRRLCARLAAKNKSFPVTMHVYDYEIIKRQTPNLEIVSGDYFFS